MTKKCPGHEGCALFPLFRIGSLARTWEIEYCEGQFERCARYKLGSCGGSVPKNLLPNGELLKVGSDKDLGRKK